MHHLIGLVIAIMALFPGVGGEGIGNLKAWMEAYEKQLYQQMYDNIENARRNEEIRKNSAKNEVLHEQTASEEAERHEHEESAVLEEPKESYAQPISTVETSAPMESESTNIQEATPLYSVNGAVLDEEIQLYLFQRLTEQNIAYFMPYAMMIIYQESKLDIYAENPNGRDKGLLQYRVEYVPWMDWRNPYQQIDYFVAQMANRAAAGCTVSEMISRHNTSDYGPYSPEYVAQVMQWAERTVQIR